MTINPLDDPEVYDHIELGGVESPGVVKITGHNREIGWDVKKGSGQSGATTTRSSDEPARFTCAFTLSDREDFDDWPAFLEVAKSTVSGKTPKAVDIYHPDLAENGIQSVVLAKVLGTVHDGLGGQVRSIEFLEYRPPVKRGGTPKGAKASAKAPDPNQAALDELARLTKKYEETKWG